MQVKSATRALYDMNEPSRGSITTVFVEMELITSFLALKGLIPAVD